DGDPAQQVEVLLAGVAPDPCALPADEGQLGRAERVHDGLGVALVQGHHLPLLIAVRILVVTPGSTWVPTPSSVKISRITACGSRPSTTGARGPPPLTRFKEGPI